MSREYSLIESRCSYGSASTGTTSTNKTNYNHLPCGHQHSGFQKLQKAQAKMMATEPSIPPVKDVPQAAKIDRT